MKRIMAALMVVVVVVSLVGCGDKISDEVKNTMTEYESLCDEYCEFAKKVADGNVLESTNDILQISSKLSDIREKVENLSAKNLNEKEKKYIAEVAERCRKKVQEAMDSLEQS